MKLIFYPPETEADLQKKRGKLIFCLIVCYEIIFILFFQIYKEWELFFQKKKKIINDCEIRL